MRSLVQVAFAHLGLLEEWIAHYEAELLTALAD